METKTKLVHCLKDNYDVYIGRGKCPKTGKENYFGNPFTHIATKGTKAEFVVDSRKEAVLRYKEYLNGNEKLIESVLKLDGKILGCWCGEKRCHGEIMIDKINEIKYSLF